MYHHELHVKVVSEESLESLLLLHPRSSWRSYVFLYALPHFRPVTVTFEDGFHGRNQWPRCLIICPLRMQWLGSTPVSPCLVFVFQSRWLRAIIRNDPKWLWQRWLESYCFPHSYSLFLLLNKIRSGHAIGRNWLSMTPIAYYLKPGNARIMR